MTTIILTLAALTLVAVWLDAVRAAVSSLSGGYIRSLEENKREKAEKWLDKKRELGFTLRALSFITTAAFTVFCFHHTVIKPIYQFNNEALQNVKEITVFCLLLLLFLIFKETLGTVWISYYRYTLLRYSLPTINILRIPLKFYEIVLMHSFKKAKAREDIANEDKEVSPEDEILSLVEGDNSGKLEDDERRMIQGVFDLNDTLVREAMTPRVKVNAINCEKSLEEAKEELVKSNYSRLPVYEEKIDTIVGVLYAKDFLNKEKTKNGTIKSLMHEVMFTPETKPLDELLENFKKSQCHFAVVNDEFGGTAGIITIEDILEEIVGDIKDEYDYDEDEQIQVLKGGGLIVDAEVTLGDINKLMPHNNIPDHDDYETISGCIYSELSRIPAVGEVIELNKYTAVILSADERSIIKLKLTPKLKDEFEETKS
jgi:putative hemolysin